tara:strand:+ start:5378 stop:5731 length:354 start_codon:yes stop_codon:yes gene_type:complete
MKITKSQLRQIIKEELNELPGYEVTKSVVDEGVLDMDKYGGLPRQARELERAVFNQLLPQIRDELYLNLHKDDLAPLKTKAGNLKVFEAMSDLVDVLEDIIVLQRKEIEALKRKSQK